jgi:hypothetical protein
MRNAKLEVGTIITSPEFNTCTYLLAESKKDVPTIPKVNKRRLQLHGDQSRSYSFVEKKGDFKSQVTGTIDCTPTLSHLRAFQEGEWLVIESVMWDGSKRPEYCRHAGLYLTCILLTDGEYDEDEVVVEFFVTGGFIGEMKSKPKIVGIMERKITYKRVQAKRPVDRMDNF